MWQVELRRLARTCLVVAAAAGLSAPASVAKPRDLVLVYPSSHGPGRVYRNDVRVESAPSRYTEIDRAADRFMVPDVEDWETVRIEDGWGEVWSDGLPVYYIGREINLKDEGCCAGYRGPEAVTLDNLGHVLSRSPDDPKLDQYTAEHDCCMPGATRYSRSTLDYGQPKTVPSWAKEKPFFARGQDDGYYGDDFLPRQSLCLYPCRVTAYVIPVDQFGRKFDRVHLIKDSRGTESTGELTYNPSLNVWESRLVPLKEDRFDYWTALGHFGDKVRLTSEEVPVIRRGDVRSPVRLSPRRELRLPATLRFRTAKPDLGIWDAVSARRPGQGVRIEGPIRANRRRAGSYLYEAKVIWAPRGPLRLRVRTNKFGWAQYDYFERQVVSCDRSKGCFKARAGD